MTGQTGVGEQVGIVVIHGVGETEPGWINRYFIPRLQEHDKALVFVDHSEVHELPDRGAGQDDARFKSYLRRTQFPDRPVAIMELFWADLSRFGRGPIANFLVMLQLFYEAPLVLGAAFLRRHQTGLRRLLAKLVLLANWLLRWPITGLNTGVFAAAVAILLLHKLREVAPGNSYLAFADVYAIAASLAALVAGSILLARRSVGYSILLSEFAVSAAICGSLLLVALLAALTFADPAYLQGPAPFLKWASVPILALWWLWSHVVVAAILILFAAALWGLFRRRTRTTGTLMRPAAALGLTTIQGMLFKIMIALTWFLLISALEPGSVGGQCKAQLRDDCVYLYELNSELVGIVIMNLVMAAMLGIGVLTIATLRGSIVRVKVSKTREYELSLPRLIVSPALVILMFALTLLNFCAFYLPKYAHRLSKFYGEGFDVPIDVFVLIRQELFDSGLIAPFAGMSLILLYLMVFRAAQNSLRGMVHIVRDLVDHQYTPEFRLSRFMLADGRHERGTYPRRRRIQERFDTLMKTIVSEESCQHLILVAHSQGSVILFDYLQSNRDDATLARASRIDVVTLGSPLAHIYRYYFPSYDASVPAARELNPKLASWTNLWRVDDPIGNRVDVVGEDFIVNERLPPGGHVDYWREPRVCEIILELIDRGATAAAGPPPIPFTMRTGT